MLPVIFRAPEPGDEAEIAAAQRIMAQEGFTFALDYSPDDEFSRWLERMAAGQRGANLRPGRVPATFELAIVERRVAGRLSVRHALNEFLLQQGGHIGYGVLPEFRGRGVAKRMLQRGLELTRALGIERALVTCLETNAPSRHIIEAAGGAYESSYAGADVGVPIRRYWLG